MIILGIETSCDETAAAIVEKRADGTGRILANCVRSQIAEHAAYGGVVPEIAARAHVEVLDILIMQAAKRAGMNLSAIDAIAATAGPGLIGGLLVGLTTAKTLALLLNKPFIAVNHLEGHALTARLTHNIAFPYLLLLVSGGHTQILLVSAIGKYRRLGTTLDDALGECFDKTAKLLGLSYPGGPALEQAAKTGNAAKFALPRPMKGTKGCDFSFSGLKTAARHVALQQNNTAGNTGGKQAAHGTQGLSKQDIADICASFEAAAADIVTDRLANAFAICREELFSAASAQADRGVKQARPVLVAAGGVAANGVLRSAAQDLCARHGFAFIAPPADLCSDNAAMIAWAGAERLALQSGGALSRISAETHKNSAAKRRVSAGDKGCNPLLPQNLDFAARARWPLDETAAAKIGSGRKGAKA